ncbi:hypothetical protein AX16_005807 [Volvariella volvacea WC 439]|nr:hypothetical protein AX16_005807 [Volvariella volvacea WC 439]
MTLATNYPVTSDIAGGVQEGAQTPCNGIILKPRNLRKRTGEIGGGVMDVRPGRCAPTPISTLPTEILTRIIRFFVGEIYYQPIDMTFRIRFQDRYRRHFIISSVCTTWRRVILNDCILWTAIRWSYLTHAPALFERSKTAPLSISLCPLNSCDEEATRATLDLVSANGHRIKDLSLDLKSVQKLGSHSLQVLWESAPTLSHCYLSGGDITLYPTYTLFSGSTPELTVLQLHQVVFSWDLPLLRSAPKIQDLEIAHPKNKPTWNQFVVTLASTPNLRKLNLWDALPEPFSPILTYSFPKLSLPRVSQLTLVDTTSKCAFFLNKAALNGDVMFTIKLFDFLDESPFYDLGPWLAGRWNVKGDGIASVYDLELSGCDIFNICVLGYPKEGKGQMHKLIIRWPVKNYDLPSAFTPWFFPLLPLSECKRFSGRQDITDDWEAFVSSMPQLEVLELITEAKTMNTSVKEIVAALTIQDTIPSGQTDLPPTQVVPLPKLKSLRIDLFDDDDQWFILYRLLRNRKEKGFGLQKFELGLIAFGKNGGFEATIRACMPRVVDHFEIVPLSP